MSVNKLNATSAPQKPAQGPQPASFVKVDDNAPMSNADLDRKYGLTSTPIQSTMPQTRPVAQPNTSNLNSNIKVDDADIPPFLRRKFNK